MYHQITTLTRDGLSVAAINAPLFFVGQPHSATVMSVLSFLVVLIFRLLEYQRGRARVTYEQEIAGLRQRVEELERQRSLPKRRIGF